jgi:ring-1,2-phenylacetyl-CoA epoxidase subunit PaaD
VPDPEIPVISIVDLGIVRAVRVAGDGACDVTITPTYSGCPAMQDRRRHHRGLHAHGVAKVRLHNQLSPAWTTDWMSEAGKAALRGYGIAPPAQQVIDISGLRGGVKRPGCAAGGRSARARCRIGRHSAPRARPARTAAPGIPKTSQFGLLQGAVQMPACREPFDYFKCH